MGGGPRAHRHRSPGWIAAALLTLMVAAGCSSSDAPQAVRSNDSAPRSSASPTTAAKAVDDASLEQPGAFGVGRTTVNLADQKRPGRTLTTDIWYPIKPGTGTEPSLYQFDASIPAFDLNVAKANAALSPGGPFPLVVFSHGSPSIRYQSLFFMELLASHGFVVAAPDHAGDSAVDALRGSLAGPAETAANRPADISFVIDALLGGDVADPPGLAAAVDPKRVGIVGHSRGGDTVLAVAGGRSGVPRDERVDAVLAWTPLSAAAPDESLASIDVPTMLFGATLDDVTPIEPNVERPWNLVVGRPLYRVDLLGGGHDQFTNVCEFRAAADANPDFPAALRPIVDVPAQDACTPELLPIAVAHTLITRYSMAFLLAHVSGDEAAAAWLRSSPASAPNTSFAART